jgi:hypothetical protein
MLINILISNPVNIVSIIHFGFIVKVLRDPETKDFGVDCKSPD